MTSLPGDTSIVFDLDAATRPQDEVHEPFVVTIGGKAVTMVDPGEFDWQDAFSIQSPDQFIDYCFSDNDREHFLNQDMLAWQLNLLMTKYMEHYGLDKKLKQAEREQQRRGARG